MKKKNKTKQKGGGIIAPSSQKNNSNQQNNFQPLSTINESIKYMNTKKPSLLERLVRAKTPKNIIIVFRSIKFYCIVGENKILIKKNNPEGEIDSNPCITLEYNFKLLKCVLDEFFYSRGKTDCIGEGKSINNTNLNKNNQPYTYNKNINKILLDFIDIININLRMCSCMLVDGSSVISEKCDKISLFSLKNLERGYGFYNEFGYLYTPSDTEELFRNFFSYTYHEHISISNRLLNNFRELMQKQLSFFFDEYNKILEKNNDKTAIDNLNKLILLIREVNPNLLITNINKIIKDLLEYCKKKQSNTISEENILFSFSNDIIVILKTFIEYSLANLQGISTEMYKLYFYNKTSVKKSFLQTTKSLERQFTMVDLPNSQLIQTSENEFTIET